MSATWTGSAQLTRFSQKFGLTDTTSLARILEWMNEIQEDIYAEYSWPSAKFAMKKYFASGSQEIDISPQIPSAPVIASGSTGTLTDTGVYRVKTTFVLYGVDENNDSNSLESEPSEASNAITISGTTKLLDVTGISTYTDTNAYFPTNIHRRIYVSLNGAAYYLYSEITNNTATTTQITANTSSTIEPPEYTMVDQLSDETILDRQSGVAIRQNSLVMIMKFDPNLTSTGNPSDYARITKQKIFLYPRTSAAKVLSYYVYRKPSRIFNDSTRVIQLDPALKKVFDAGVTWKMYEYRDQDGQESKLNNYEELKKNAWERNGRILGSFGVVTEVD
jgi:hypothetical protein